jgi:hypothetical protein
MLRSGRASPAQVMVRDGLAAAARPLGHLGWRALMRRKARHRVEAHVARLVATRTVARVDYPWQLCAGDAERTIWVVG